MIDEYLEYQDGKVFWKVDRGFRHVKGKEAGSDKDKGYRRIKLFNKQYLTHQVVWYLHYGYFPKMLDHIDGNRVNNKIENLRECSYTENKYNSKLHANNTTGVKGLIFDRTTNKYVARITVNKKRIYLGSYNDIELAELVLDEARDKFHGNFARNT